jgi:hypothetical protein
VSQQTAAIPPPDDVANVLTKCPRRWLSTNPRLTEIKTLPAAPQPKVEACIKPLLPIASDPALTLTSPPAQAPTVDVEISPPLVLNGIAAAAQSEEKKAPKAPPLTR